MGGEGCNQRQPQPLLHVSDGAYGAFLRLRHGVRQTLKLPRQARVSG